MSIVIDGKEYYGIIYKIENTINHKIYIGQTTNPRGFNGRYSCDGVGAERVHRRMLHEIQRNVQPNMHLFSALEKYGTNNFVVDEVYDTALTAEELNEKEMYYIAKFDSYHNGYNMSVGADNMLGMTGELCHNSKRVCQLSLDGELIKIWNSATEAHNELGVCSASISNVCYGKKLRKGGDTAKTAGGYVWVFEKDYDQNKDYSVNRPRQNMGHGAKIILLLADDGSVMQEFYSINEASRQLGITVESARKTCMHKFKKPRFNLVYKDEYMEEQRLIVRESYEVAS